MNLSPQEIGQLLNRYWAPLVAWVGREHPFAEDVVQGAFVKLATQSPPPTDIAAWLFQVTRLLAINEVKAAERRRQREKAAHDLQVPHVASSSQKAGENTPDLIASLMTRLAPCEREIVVAKIWGELTFDRIAELVELPKSRVWRIYQSAIVKLRSYVEQGHHE